MGRLFWKFFFALLLAQIVSVLGVGLLIGLHNRQIQSENASGQRHGGPPPRFSAEMWGEDEMFESPGPHNAPRGGPPPRFRPGGGHPPQHSLIPMPPLLSGLAASLIFAALLAWYFAKPIRSLSRAFDAVSQGDLSVRLSAEMGGRRDELADLGRDFDSMAQRLQGLMDGQRRLFHDVSHELRSPLTRLQVAVGLARQQPERAEQVLQRIERESVRMDQLVSELLTLARLESGMSASMHEAIALSEFIGNIIEDSRVEAEARHCQLLFDAGGIQQAHAEDEDSGEIFVRGNPEFLRRGVENVLRNAIKYSPQDTQIRVSLRRVDGNAGDRVAIAILDQGSGVSETSLPHIFQPFFRSAGEYSAEGYGLGLAIAQRVVVMHDGSISARNINGGGFEVTITLPLAAA
ncbi:ATP-binding protein [Uliginosibacterium sp. H3]|uniref:histidine kinase n=1 Tax=Uliginosibacterium silvisoli TaxID=3114758 RepID=A0ABU6K1U7_9RHOO|nr:ATP-binding protein [Uliginosibacterium sp. H3]